MNIRCSTSIERNTFFNQVEFVLSLIFLTCFFQYLTLFDFKIYGELQKNAYNFIENLVLYNYNKILNFGGWKIEFKSNESC